MEAGAGYGPRLPSGMMSKSPFEGAQVSNREGTPSIPTVLVVGSTGALAEDLAIELNQDATVHKVASPRAALLRAKESLPWLLLLTEESARGDDAGALIQFAEQNGIARVLLAQRETAQALAQKIRATDYYVPPFDARLIASRLLSLLTCRELEMSSASLFEARYQFAVEGASLGVWELDLEEKQVSCSAVLRDILGLSPGTSLQGEDEWLSLIHPQDRGRVEKARRALREGVEREIRLEYRMVRRDERIVWVKEVARALVKEQRVPVRLMGVIIDTTQQRASERRIVQLSNFDLLTDLPNRKKCCELLVEALDRARSTGASACLFRINISGLANINQTRRRTAGDQILQQLSRRLRECAPDPGKVCRLGGKEFAFIVEQIDGPSRMARAAELAAEVAATLAEPLDLDGETVTCPVHTGACVFPDDGNDPEDLLRKADIALADATQDALMFAVFRKSMLKRVESRQRLQSELQRAVFSGEISLAYQPIVDGSGQVVAVEGLARWQHPTRGQIPAADFIPLAIESGLVVPLGASLRRVACEQLLKWAHDPRTSHLVISLNVSSLEFATEAFAKDLLLLIDSMQIDPRRLQLELSESILRGDRAPVEMRVKALSNAGIRLALDDFGTGQTSLTLLKQLPFHQLKLDHSFVSEILTDPVNASISRAIIAMAHNLGLEVIAEGVEEESQARLLTEMGCARFQGYFFGRATDALTIESRVSEEASALSLAVPSFGAPVSRSLVNEFDARILIVDDDPTTLQLMSRILRDYADTRTTTSPLRALKMVEESPPDLLLLDTQMPELTGFELWDTLRKNPAYADIPAVFVTALLDPETEIKALSMGAVDFVSKPISAARLLLAVRNQVRIKRQTDSLKQQASVDPLTEVANRRSFNRALDREWARSIEGGSSLSLLMVDVDHFKHINDNFGHPAGDRCLISVARLLTHIVRRPLDLVARYGGEEFAVILPLLESEQAAQVANAVVQQVAATNFKDDLGAEHHVTVSVGFTTMHGGSPTAHLMKPEAIVRHADEALLLAKASGRNQACGPDSLAMQARKSAIS